MGSTIFFDKFCLLRKLLVNSLKNLVKLHDAWHQAEPDSGHGDNAAEYRQQLAQLAQLAQVEVP